MKKFFYENLGFFGILGYPRKSRDFFENPGMGISGFELKIPWDTNIPGLGFFFVGWDIPAICNLCARELNLWPLFADILKIDMKLKKPEFHDFQISIFIRNRDPGKSHFDASSGPLRCMRAI